MSACIPGPQYHPLRVLVNQETKKPETKRNKKILIVVIIVNKKHFRLTAARTLPTLSTITKLMSVAFIVWVDFKEIG